MDITIISTQVMAITGMITGIAAVVALLITIIKKTKEPHERKAQKIELLEEGMLAILHDRLYDLIPQYIAQGHISHEDYENILYLYEPYEKMGGNGTAKRLMEELKKQPTQ